MTLTADRLRELLHYDPETGVFTWRVKRRCVEAGAAAGSISPSRYRTIMVAGKNYQAHRLAWLYTTGEWPAEDIDHINGVRSDNRIANLRTCTRAQNSQNTCKRSNRSGARGVWWHARAQKWAAGITVNYKAHHLGLFDDIESASAAYVDAKARFHTFHPEVRAA
jgi:hypothetical protein